MKLNWCTYCATNDNRNQCSEENCLIFFICLAKHNMTLPKGVSQWLEEGKKYGYLDYFFKTAYFIQTDKYGGQTFDTEKHAEIFLEKMEANNKIQKIQYRIIK